MNPQPGMTAQPAPQNAKIKIRTLLVNTPVTVRNDKGEMINTLEKSDFRVTDNGVPQVITHFTLGGDPVSLVVVVETSDRILADPAADSKNRDIDFANRRGAGR